MERPKIKAINFDLDTNAMRELGEYPNGYRKLGAELNKHGFSHRQGSGYISNQKINNIVTEKIISNILIYNPWLLNCINKLDVTDVGKKYDFTYIVKALKQLNIHNLSSEIPKRAGETKSNLIIHFLFKTDLFSPTQRILSPVVSINAQYIV